jgi:hypothetical protein
MQGYVSNMSRDITLLKEPLFYNFVRGSFTTSISTCVLTLVVKEPLTTIPTSKNIESDLRVI